MRAMVYEYQEVVAQRPYSKVLNAMAERGWRVSCFISNFPAAEQIHVLMERPAPTDWRKVRNTAGWYSLGVAIGLVILILIGTATVRIAS